MRLNVIHYNLLHMVVDLRLEKCYCSHGGQGKQIIECGLRYEICASWCDGLVQTYVPAET